MRTPTVFSREPLIIYLNDHLAGATAGVELARRVASENETSPLGPPLDRLADAIERDRDELLAIMGELDVPVDRAKVALGWTAEKVGRLKPNDRLRGYSPLGRVLELEGLVAGVHAKQSAWRTLRNADLVDTGRIELLLDRARKQLVVLQRLHRTASVLALGDGVATSEDVAVGSPSPEVAAGGAIGS
jgi:hypothetical protein